MFNGKVVYSPFHCILLKRCVFVIPITGRACYGTRYKYLSVYIKIFFTIGQFAEFISSRLICFAAWVGFASLVSAFLHRIAKFLFFLSIHNYPFGLCCSEKNFMVFQQFKEFFRRALPPGVTHPPRTAQGFSMRLPRYYSSMAR